MSEGIAMQDSRRYAASLLGTIVGDATGSRFFWELVDKAMAETATMNFGPMDGTGAFYSYIRCGVEKADEVMSVVRGIFDGVDKEGVTEDETEAQKWLWAAADRGYPQASEVLTYILSDDYHQEFGIGC